MKSFDFRPFEALYPEWESAFLNGAKPREFSFKRTGPVSLYGTADMLINRYIMGTSDDLSEGDKDLWASVINSFQTLPGGHYKKTFTNHFKAHTSAYATAALSLIDRRPLHPQDWATKVTKSKKAFKQWIRSVPWSLIWPGSHIVAGLPAVLIMTGEEAQSFFQLYFDFLNRTASPKTGFWSRGLAQKTGLMKPLSKHEMGGAFHMYFIYEALGWQWPCPEQVVDATLKLQKEDGLFDPPYPYCIDLDGVYNLLRSSRNADGYRRIDVARAVESFLARAEKTLNDRDFLEKHYIHSHRITGALAAIAECALFFPDWIKTEKPWRQSLDKAPFI